MTSVNNKPQSNGGSNTANSGSPVSPTTALTQAAKARLNELFVRFLTLPESESLIKEIIAEVNAAASTPIPVAQTQSERAPSPPPSPPRSSTLLKLGNPERTPSPVSRFALGVDEVDIANQKAHSPGAASPVSPTAIRHAVDPSLPHPVHNEGSVVDVGAVKSATASPRSSSLQLTSFDKVHGSRDSINSSPVNGSLNASFKELSVSLSQQPPTSGKGFRTATVEDIPIFFRPLGLVPANDGQQQEVESLVTIFGVRNAKNRMLEIDTTKAIRRLQFGKVCTDVFGLPAVLRDILFRRILASNGIPDTGTSASLNFEQVKRFYDGFAAKKSKARRLFELLRRDIKREFLTLDDLRLCARALVDFHPGLTFLSQIEFQDLYCQTVAIRIVHRWERNRGNCILWADFERSDVTEVLAAVDKLSDINQILCYFTYEHFYVLYCRFWELDTDRDYLIGIEDLRRYNNGALTDIVLHRALSGFGRKLTSGTPKMMNFEDFVHFCLCEEDKNNPQAVEYWFRICDLDQDGVLSGYELQELYREQKERFSQLGSEEMHFDDMLCQMIDMVGADKLKVHKFGFTISDLKKCPTAGNFFNMLFNASKFLQFEHRDPFQEFHLKQQAEKTDWDRFARLEYDRMATEAGGN